MKGVSEVIAIILILMITISLAGLAYMFMNTTMADVTSSAGSTVDTTTSSMLTSFKIESMDVAKVYVRNTGQNAITSLSVYVNDAPAHINMTPSIAPGQIGTITIYDFIAEDDTIKITSPSGFSTSKKAPDPCEKATACWKLDEGSGAAVYDSSPHNANGASLVSATWTTGKYGNAISVTGGSSGGYAAVPSTVSSSEYTIQFWFKYSAWPQPAFAGFMGKGTSFSIEPVGDGSITFMTYTGGSINSAIGSTDLGWHMVTITRSNSIVKFYFDGVLGNTDSDCIVDQNSNWIAVGRGWSYGFNGIIDEARFYDRSIY